MELAIELILGVLLIATCAYCYVLSGRLRALREGQKEMLSVIGAFDEASRRAENTLSSLQTNSADVNRELNAASARAYALKDELSVMIEAGDRIAQRIETVVGEVRAIAKNRAATGPATRAASGAEAGR